MAVRFTNGVRAISFDADGCLWEPNEGMYIAFTQAFEGEGLRVPDFDVFMEFVARGQTMPKNMTQLLTEHSIGEATEERIARMYAAYVSGLNTEGYKHFKLFDHTEGALRTLRAVGAAMNVLSNKDQGVVAKALQHCGVLDCFDFVLGAKDGEPSKPDAAVFSERIAPGYGELLPDLAGNEILVVGDTGSDKNFAAAIGAPFAWASYGDGKPGTGDGAEFHLEQLSDLCRTLEVASS